MGDILKGNCSVGVGIYEKELGGNRGHAKSTRGIPSSRNYMYFRDDGAVYNDQIVGVALGD